MSNAPSEGIEYPTYRRRRRRTRRPQRAWYLAGALLVTATLVTAAFVYWGKRPPKEEPRPTDKLLGTWEASVPNAPKGKVRLEVRPDTIGVRGWDPSTQRDTYEEHSWKVLAEGTERMTLRLSHEGNKQTTDWEAEFLPSGQLRIKSLTSDMPVREYSRVDSTLAPMSEAERLQKAARSLLGKWESELLSSVPATRETLHFEANGRLTMLTVTQDESNPTIRQSGSWEIEALRDGEIVVKCSGKGMPEGLRIAQVTDNALLYHVRSSDTTSTLRKARKVP